MARKKKVKVPKEVLTSECRTVPKTECVDEKVRLMELLVQLLVIGMVVVVVAIIPHIYNFSPNMQSLV